VIPGIGEIQEDGVGTSLIEAVGDIPDLEIHPVDNAPLLAVTPCQLGELLPLLVGDDLSRIADEVGQNRGQTPGTGAALDHKSPGEDIERYQDKTDILGVKDLGLSPDPAAELLYVRAQEAEGLPQVGIDPTSERFPNKVVMQDLTESCILSTTGDYLDDEAVPLGWGPYEDQIALLYELFHTLSPRHRHSF